MPARALKDTVPGTNQSQRDKLVEEVKKLKGQTNTPTSRSYAETIAYLMGQTTKGGFYNPLKPKYFSYEGSWAECTNDLCTNYSWLWGRPNLNGLIQDSSGFVETCLLVLGIFVIKNNYHRRLLILIAALIILLQHLKIA